MNGDDVVETWAVINKVSTLADGGLRVVLDLPEQAVDEAARLMELKRKGVVVKVEISEVVVQ